MKWRRWVAPILAAVAAAWCVGMRLWLWFTPMRYVGFAVGSTRQEILYRPFSEVSRFGPLPLILPASVAMAAAWAARRGNRIGLGASTILFAVFTFVAGFSIGANYLPAAGALILATILAALLGSGITEDSAE